MKRHPRRPLLCVVVAFLTAVVLAGCGSATSEGAGATAGGVRTVAAAEAVREIGSRSVIDVRTPQEYAAGHLAGARNIDVEAGDFEERIATLDRDAAYLLYCRSGRRSAIAAQMMAEAGFTDVIDAGGLDDLAGAGAQLER